MAMNQLQQPEKTIFYQEMRNHMSSLNRQMTHIKELCEYLDNMDATTLDNMSVPASGADEGLRADLLAIRTQLTNLVTYFETNVEEIVNRLRGSSS